MPFVSLASLTPSKSGADIGWQKVTCWKQNSEPAGTMSNNIEGDSRAQQLFVLLVSHMGEMQSKDNAIECIYSL